MTDTRNPGCRNRTAGRGCRGRRPAPGQLAVRPPRPSTVVTSAPSACTAKTRQDRTASPSRSTVHAPQTPCSQPRCVPVRSQRSRRKSASVSRGSTASARGAVDVDDDLGLRHPWPPRRRAERAGRAARRPAPGSRPRRGGRRHRRRGRPRPAARPRRRHVGAPRPTMAASALDAALGGGAEAEEPDPAAGDVPVVVELHRHGGAGDGEVAVASGQLLDRAADAPLPDREPDADEHLVVGQLVVQVPVKNSDGGMVRRPVGDRTSSSASRASATAGYSAAGSAWAIEPPTVPRLRIWKCPMNGVARASSGTAGPPPRSARWWPGSCRRRSRACRCGARSSSAPRPGGDPRGARRWRGAGRASARGSARRRGPWRSRPATRAARRPRRRWRARGSRTAPASSAAPPAASWSGLSGSTSSSIDRVNQATVL